MRVRRMWAVGMVGVVAWALVLTGCAGGSRSARLESPPQLPAGPLFASRAAYRFAIFHAPKPAVSVRPKVEELVRQRFTGLRLAAEGAGAEPLPTVRVTERDMREYPLPEQGMLELAARDLSPQEQAQLAASERVTVLEFTTAPPAFEAVRQAHGLALELVRATGGLLWDEQVGELFSADGWYERRLEGWDGGEPLMARHFNTRVYSEADGTVRLLTAGLGTFGLPDIGVQQVPAPLAKRLGSLINVVAQLMVEGIAVRKDSTFHVAIKALKLSSWREHLLEQVQPNAAQHTIVGLLPLELEGAGDDHRYVEMIFQARPGDSASERPYGAVAELFGARDEIVSSNHDEELMAASRRARETLLTRIKPRFQEGRESEAKLLVKAPFDTASGGTEWMWIHVTRWDGPLLHGVLDSEPDDVPTVKAGSPVTVSEDILFDYIWLREDGSTEGNETERIILERAGKAR